MPSSASFLSGDAGAARTDGRGARPGRGDGGRRAGLLTAAIYAALFAALGAHLPFWPAWLRGRGLSEVEIGGYLGLALAARIAGATLLPMLADRFALRRALLAGAAVLSAALVLLHIAVEGYRTLLVVGLAAGFALGPLIPLGEGLGVRAATRWGFSYGRARAAGSVAFLLMNAAMGWALASLGADAVLWAIVAGLVLLAALAPLHPGGGAPPGAGNDRAGLTEGAALLCHPAFLAFALAASLGQASHAVYYGFSVLHWSAQGIGGPTIGLLWATGVMAEIGLLLGPGRAWVTRLGASRALALGTGAGVLRWGLMALEPPVALLWPLQGLHAFTFAVAHLGAIAFAAAALPPRLQASAQGIVGGAMGGVAIAVATAAAGAIGGALGLAAAYWLAAAMSALALAAALVLARRWRPGESLVA